MSVAHEFTIRGRLPSMNEYTNAQRINRYKGAQMKKCSQETALKAILSGVEATEIKTPIRLHYIFYEPNMRRDLDNIASFAHKVVQDALVESGKINNDGWRHVVGFTDTFTIDKDNPRIIVLIEEVAADG